MRQPLASALGLILVNIVLFTIRAFFTAPSATTAAERLDYALSNIAVSTVTFGGEVVIAGIVAQVIAMAHPLQWGNFGKLVPSPAEESIETRFAFGTGTIISLLLLTLLIGDWVVAGAAAPNLVKDRLASTAQMAVQSVPIFLETGQNLSSQFSADPRLANAEEPMLSWLVERGIEPEKHLVEEIFRAAKERDRVLTDEEVEQILKFATANGEALPLDTLETWKSELKRP